jgi:hypothetical protein
MDTNSDTDARRITSARSWSAPVLWRFGRGRNGGTRVEKRRRAAAVQDAGAWMQPTELEEVLNHEWTPMNTNADADVRGLERSAEHCPAFQPVHNVLATMIRVHSCAFVVHVPFS